MLGINYNYVSKNSSVSDAHFFFADPDPGKNLHGDPVPDPRGSGKNDFLSFFSRFR